MSTWNRLPYRFKRAFTLIELLVVIAIIAILAAILLPVFAQVREKARAASCMSNLKQVSIATMQYTQDYDEMEPTGYWSDDISTYIYWYDIIMPYVATANTDVALINTCQSATTGKGVMAYSLNARVGGDSSDTWFNYKTAASLAMMTHPASTILVGDAAQIPAYQHNPLTVFRVNPGSVNGGPWNDYEAAGNSKDWDTIDNDTNSAGTSPGQVRYRHQGGANFGFCDGHVKWMKRGSVTIFNWQISGDVPDTLTGSPLQYRTYR